MNEQIRAEYSQGVCGDGAAILKDGQPMTIDEIAAELNQAAHARYVGSGLVRKDYIRRLIAGVRKAIEQDPETIAARKELGEEVTIGRWVDASILCDVVEQDVLSATPAQPKVPDTAVDLLKAAQGAIRLDQPDTAHGYIGAVIDVLSAQEQTK